MKAYGGRGSIAPRILGLGSRWRWVVSFTPQPLYPQGKSPCYLMNKRLCGPLSRSGRGGEEKNSTDLIHNDKRKMAMTEFPLFLSSKCRPWWIHGRMTSLQA